jgi:hypothetical protein
MVLIHCDEEQVALAYDLFPCQVSEFPLTYLGIPLSVHKIPKSALQPLVDWVADKLPTWKGSLMQHSGRLCLITTTISVVPIYTSIGIGLPPTDHGYPKDNERVSLKWI